MEREPTGPKKQPVRNVLAWCHRALAQYRQRCRALDLATMSDHELRDLGIGRSEVPALLRGRSGRGAAG